MLVANNGKYICLFFNLILIFVKSAACVATLNGYLMLYDLRCNLIYNIFQLCDHDNKPLPIISLGHLPKAQNHVCPDIELINIGFGSNNHELGFWNVINAAQDNLNPLIYMVSTYEENPIFKIPYLVKKEESFTNFNYKYSERSVYEYFSLMSSYNDVLSFLDDPLMRTQNNIKQVWLEESKYTLSRITRLFEYKNTVKKSVGFSQISGGSSNQKTLENVLITVGNDRNIRYWTIQGEMKGQFDKRRLGGHVNNADGRERLFKQEKNGDILIVHEFEKTLNTSVQQGRENESQELWEEGFRYDEKASHKDNIEDVLFVEREKGALIVTGSRDNTIKVWK